MGTITLSMIALLVGALSVPCAFLSLLGWGVFLAVALVAAGFALGALGIMRDGEHSGLAVIGIACSLIGVVITIVCFSCAGCAALAEASRVAAL